MQGLRVTIGKGSELEEQMTEYGKSIEQDVVEKILSTQPPKTLMRFKCISKWWYDLISSPRFISKHFFNSKHNDPSTTCVLVKHFVRNQDSATTDESEMVFSLLHFCYDNENDGGGSITLSSVEDLVTLADESIHIVGHCNGIVCLATIDYNKGMPKTSDVYLWNPAIQDFKFLPRETFLPDWTKVPDHVVRENPYFPLRRYEDTLGFGYDPKSDGYKVVDIVFSGSKTYGTIKNKHVIIYPPRAVVYTTVTNSWRELKTSCLERETSYLWPEIFQLYLKGMCYWLGFEQLKEFLSFYDIRDEEHIGLAIISFDTSEEVFQEILLPYELLEYRRTRTNYDSSLELRLTVWKEFVALFALRIGDQNPNDYNAMWVMDERGAWRKYLSFKKEDVLYRFPERTLAFWKSNEVLGVTENGLIALYNLITKSIKYLESIAIPDYRFCGVPYVNSIVIVSN